MRGAKEINATMPMLPNELLLNNDLFFIEVTRMLSQGRSVTLRAKGKSMYPFISSGRDTVELRKTDTLSGGTLCWQRCRKEAMCCTGFTKWKANNSY